MVLGGKFGTAVRVQHWGEAFDAGAKVWNLDTKFGTGMQTSALGCEVWRSGQVTCSSPIFHRSWAACPKRLELRALKVDKVEHPPDDPVMAPEYSTPVSESVPLRPTLPKPQGLRIQSPGMNSKLLLAAVQLPVR